MVDKLAADFMLSSICSMASLCPVGAFLFLGAVDIWLFHMRSLSLGIAFLLRLTRFLCTWRLYTTLYICSPCAKAAPAAEAVLLTLDDLVAFSFWPATARSGVTRLLTSGVHLA